MLNGRSHGNWHSADRGPMRRGHIRRLRWLRFACRTYAAQVLRCATNGGVRRSVSSRAWPEPRSGSPAAWSATPIPQQLLRRPSAGPDRASRRDGAQSMPTWPLPSPRRRQRCPCESNAWCAWSHRATRPPARQRDEGPKARCPYGLHMFTLGEQARSRRRTPALSGIELARLNSVPPLNSTVHDQNAPISAF